MRARFASGGISFVFLLLLIVFGHAAEFPGEHWAKATPAEANLDEAKLNEARDYALTGGGSGYVVRGGKLVLAWGDAAQRYDLKSSTKSFGSAALGLAIQDGKMQLSDKARKFHPTLGTPPDTNTQTGWIDEITIQHLASQTAGFDKAGGYVPLLFAPGTEWSYSDSGPNWLAECITLAYRRDLDELMSERLFTPIGIRRSDLVWRKNQYRPDLIDGIKRREFGAGISANVDAMARFGLLWLRGGEWNGTRILPREYVDKVRTTAPGLKVRLPEQYGTASNHYGLLWWNNADEKIEGVPVDTYWTWGLYDSLIVVMPTLDLVVARAGQSWKRTPNADHYDVLKPFLLPIVQAARTKAEPKKTPGASAAPYPPSPIIQGIEWAPRESIIHQAKGSDNWPMTWADDDALYTAYGDGNGFEPFVSGKLSLGLAKITGTPPGIRGVNIRTESGEALGDGKRGRKASGMLCVDGVLYLLVRNAANAQLGWSSDHGTTWTWADWKFTESFGCPTFLNFGKNYADARDGYVYLYSQDSDSAYERTDRFVMARVPKERLRERGAYEFFVKLDPSARPIWSRNVAERGAVFTNPGACYRSGITYDAGLRRYLWCHIGPGNDTRYTGGFAIYDAPEPWGPWTTAFHTETWDVGPGETNSLPAKWMSKDGKTVHLVFSGDDHFSVRRGTIALRGKASKSEPYFPPPESQGGWRMLTKPEDIRDVAGMDAAKLDALREWLLKSDDRKFAAVVIRRGHVVLQVERGNSAVTDSRRVASVSKAICATVLAIASEWSQQGKTPRKMTFEDRAFDFIPWAQPLSDPRKAQITVKQLFNHTSGICPEATGARNEGTWQYVLGHTGDPKTAELAFNPGTACGYSTLALHHASLVCENVTGKPYDQFAIEALLQPIGCEHWWFESFDGDAQHGRHPSHSIGLPARDLARIGYCMLHDGRWSDRQIIPKWFVEQTASPTHDVRTPELRFKMNAQVFSHGWQLPALLGKDGADLPRDAREKPGSGGQLLAFVPSLDLVIARQTGSSGDWQYEEFLRRACAAVLRAN
jgi:CubicO group peptidase (beta-lactamase class C family)